MVDGKNFGMKSKKKVRVVMNNLSDGMRDGFALFYLKNQKLNSVLITQEQSDILDMMLSIVFGSDIVKTSPANDVKRYLV